MVDVVVDPTGVVVVLVVGAGVDVLVVVVGLAGAGVIVGLRAASPGRQSRVPPAGQESVVAKSLQSLSFLGPEVGFAVDVPPTSRAHPRADAFLVRTENGGASWRRISRLPGTAVKGNLESAQLGFLDNEDGVLLVSGSLFATRNGGQTWSEVVRPRLTSRVAGGICTPRLSQNRT